MSTQYRLVVHCDETRSPECHGLLEFSTRYRNRLAGPPEIEAQGWLRGYRPDQTYDVCPACRPFVDRERGLRAAQPAAPTGI
jgi:hypothetical protein